MNRGYHSGFCLAGQQGEAFVSSPTLKQILDALKKQVLVGRTYLDTAKGLLLADSVLLQTAPTFFGTVVDGSLELAQMTIAGLYDSRRNRMSVPSMLKRVENEAGAFTRSNGQEVREAIASSQKIADGLETVIASIAERRNGWLAHLDPQTIADPKALEARAKLTVPELERSFKDTEGILLKISVLYDGTAGELKYVGGDYEVALDWIRRAKCAYIERYESMFKVKWDGPRPKDFPRKDWELL